jgi:hypothetical protein
VKKPEPKYDPNKQYWLKVNYLITGKEVENYIKLLQQKNKHFSYIVEEKRN